MAKALEHFAAQRRNEQLAEELRRKTEELRELNADLQRRAASCSCGFMREHAALAHAAVILDHLPLGVLALNGDGVVLQMNREAADLLQVADGQLVGRRLAEALPQFAALDGFSASPSGSGTIESGEYRLNLRQFHPPADGEVELLVTIARAA